MLTFTFLPLIGICFAQFFFWIGLLDVSSFKIETLLPSLDLILGSMIVLAARRLPKRSHVPLYDRGCAASRYRDRSQFYTRASAIQRWS